jgi:dihydrofolate reductase
VRLGALWRGVTEIVLLDRVSDAFTQPAPGAGVGGPELAVQAFRAGLVDECHLFLTPIIVGSGKRSLPEGIRMRLELLDERRFVSGVVHLRYRVVPA